MYQCYIKTVILMEAFKDAQNSNIIFMSLTIQKSLKFGLQNFVSSTSKYYISLSFQQNLPIVVSKSKLRYALFKIKHILKIKQKNFVLLLIKRRYIFMDTWYYVSMLY